MTQAIKLTIKSNQNYAKSYELSWNQKLLYTSSWLIYRLHNIFAQARAASPLPDNNLSHLTLAKRLQIIQGIFSSSCQEALKDQDFSQLAHKLNETAPEFIAVAFEAASMGLALLDQTTPWKKSRWQTLLEEYGQAHVYSMHLGLGMALAKLDIAIDHDTLNSFNPLFRYLIVDGYGFYLGYFDAQKYITEQFVPIT